MIQIMSLKTYFYFLYLPIVSIQVGTCLEQTMLGHLLQNSFTKLYYYQDDLQIYKKKQKSINSN